MSITPLNQLYDNHSIVSMNFIVQITQNVPFRILIYNYDSTPYRLKTFQTVVHISPHAGFEIPTLISLREILGAEETVSKQII